MVVVNDCVAVIVVDEIVVRVESIVVALLVLVCVRVSVKLRVVSTGCPVVVVVVLSGPATNLEQTPESAAGLAVATD